MSGVNDFRPSIVEVAAGNCSPSFFYGGGHCEGAPERLHFILGSAGVTWAGKLSLCCRLLMCQNLSREHRWRENINIQNIQTYDLSASAQPVMTPRVNWQQGICLMISSCLCVILVAGWIKVWWAKLRNDKQVVLDSAGPKLREKNTFFSIWDIET